MPRSDEDPSRHSDSAIERDLVAPPEAKTDTDQQLLDFIKERDSGQSESKASGEKAGSVPDREGTKGEPPPGVRRPPKNWSLVLLGLLIVCGAIALLAGAKQRGELSSLFSWLTLRSRPEVVLLESGHEKALFLETDGKRSRVLVQLPDRESWRLVSRDDFTAANPALSPDGSWVAYLSTQDAPRIVVVPLDRSGRLTYTSTNLKDHGRRSDIEVTEVCDWTPIAWAADSVHLAFFGCSEDPALSRAFVGAVSASNMTLRPGLITGTVASGVEPRQILWLGADQVSVTFPPSSLSGTETVKTFPVH